LGAHRQTAALTSSTTQTFANCTTAPARRRAPGGHELPAPPLLRSFRAATSAKPPACRAPSRLSSPSSALARPRTRPCGPASAPQRLLRAAPPTAPARPAAPPRPPLTRTAANPCDPASRHLPAAPDPTSANCSSDPHRLRRFRQTPSERPLNGDDRRPPPWGLVLVMGSGPALLQLTMARLGRLRQRKGEGRGAREARCP